ncbi:hypothetical protein HK100_005952, partial [Physocladia obscura]
PQPPFCGNAESIGIKSGSSVVQKPAVFGETGGFFDLTPPPLSPESYAGTPAMSYARYLEQQQQHQHQHKHQHQQHQQQQQQQQNLIMDFAGRVPVSLLVD